MVGLTSLEVYISVLNKTEENNIFIVYLFPHIMNGSIAFAIVRDDIGKDWESSDITATDLQDENIGPIFIEEYKKDASKRMKSDEFMNFLATYNKSIFQELKSFLRTEIDSVEDDVRLVFDEYTLKFSL